MADSQILRFQNRELLMFRGKYDEAFSDLGINEEDLEEKAG